MANAPKGLPVMIPEDVILSADEREIIARLEEFQQMVEDGSIKDLPSVREQLKEHLDRLSH